MDDKQNDSDNLKEVLNEFYDSHKRLIITVGTIAATLAVVYAAGKVFRIFATTTNHYKDWKTAVKRKP